MSVDLRDQCSGRLIMLQDLAIVGVRVDVIESRLLQQQIPYRDLFCAGGVGEQISDGRFQREFMLLDETEKGGRGVLH